MASFQGRKDRFCVMCFADAIALRFQASANQQPNLWIAVDDEYVGLGHANAAPWWRQKSTLPRSNVKTVSCGSVRDQDGYRHVFEHEVGYPSKDEFADACMSVGTHDEQIGSKVEGPRLESLAGSQAGCWEALCSRRDIMARQGGCQFGTWNAARSLQRLLGVGPADRDSFRLLEQGYGIEGCPCSFTGAVPANQNLSPKRSGGYRIWNEKERTSNAHDEAFNEVELDAEAVRPVDLACDHQIRRHAMLDDRVSHKRCLAIHETPLEVETRAAHSVIEG